MPESPIFLMCPPDYYGVTYEINAWMQGNIGAIDHALAVRQWQDLHTILEKIARVEVMTPESGLPDLVFTANAGLVLGERVVVSRFRPRERQGEEPFFRAWFAEHGFDVLPWPDHALFEGAGDALWDRGVSRLWAGNGFRSSRETAALLQTTFRREVVSINLVNPRFYHLDTCLCPLSGGLMMYAPMAFDSESLARIETLVPAERRIAVDDESAYAFACNAVEANGRLVMNGASTALRQELVDRGFMPIITSLSEYMKAGGGAKCLTLRIDEAE